MLRWSPAAVRAAAVGPHAPGQPARRHAAGRRHARLTGSRGRRIERSHLLGGQPAPVQAQASTPTDALLRPLAEYDALVGGGW